MVWLMFAGFVSLTLFGILMFGLGVHCAYEDILERGDIDG